MNSLSLSFLVFFSLLLKFIFSEGNIDFIVGQLILPPITNPAQKPSFVIQGKTTYSGLKVIHASKVEFKFNGAVPEPINQINYTAPQITDITTQQFKTTITCDDCTTNSFNIFYVCDSSHYNLPTDIGYCVQTNITIPQYGVLSFIVSSNLDSNSKSFVLDRIKEDYTSVFFMMLGNLYKSPKDSDSKETYLKKYQKYIFDNSKLSDLLRSKPFIYFFNELDFAGKDSGAKSKGVKAINQAYRDTFPNYIEEDQTEGIYQAVNLNGVMFIMTDSRTFMDTKNKKFFGDTQRKWLKEKFKAALEDQTVFNIIITVTQPWNYVKDEYDIDIVKQDFKSLTDDIAEEKNVFFEVLQQYQNEKGSPFNFYFPVRAHLEQEIGKPSIYKSILLIVGERHLAFDTGRWNNFGSFPIAVAGPLDSWQECRGGPYSHGSFHDSKHQYLSVIAKKDCLILRGIIANNDDNIGDQIVFAYDTCSPDSFPGRLDRKCPMVWKEKFIHAFILVFAGILVGFIFFFVFYWVGMNSFKFRYEKLKTQ